MSFDLGLTDPRTGDWYKLTQPHHMRGGTYCLGGCDSAEINITYNYSAHFYRVLPKDEGDNEVSGGIRKLYGMTGAESIPILEAAIAQLGDEMSHDYWEATEGNAKVALKQCLALAQMCPDGVWEGD